MFKSMIKQARFGNRNRRGVLTAAAIQALKIGGIATAVVGAVAIAGVMIYKHVNRDPYASARDKMQKNDWVGALREIDRGVDKAQDSGGDYQGSSSEQFLAFRNEEVIPRLIEAIGGQISNAEQMFTNKEFELVKKHLVEAGRWSEVLDRSVNVYGPHEPILVDANGDGVKEEVDPDVVDAQIDRALNDSQLSKFMEAEQLLTKLTADANRMQNSQFFSYYSSAYDFHQAFQNYANDVGRLKRLALDIGDANLIENVSRLESESQKLLMIQGIDALSQSFFGAKQQVRELDGQISSLESEVSSLQSRHTQLSNLANSTSPEVTADQKMSAAMEASRVATDLMSKQATLASLQGQRSTLRTTVSLAEAALSAAVIVVAQGVKTAADSADRSLDTASEGLEFPEIPWYHGTSTEAGYDNSSSTTVAAAEVPQPDDAERSRSEGPADQGETLGMQTLELEEVGL